jgi:hypothetical protein
MAAWLRGELTPDEEAAWLASSAADPALASEVAAHRRTIESLRELPREIEPGRDLYPGIAARLTPARRRAGWTVALAAALMLAAGLALLVRLQRSPTSGAGQTVPAIQTQAPRLPGDTAIARSAYRDTDRALADIRRELRRTIDARQDELPPETRQLVFENLRVIDQAIADIEEALAAQPGDDQLARTYIAYREREIDLLRQVNRMAAKL